MLMVWCSLWPPRQTIQWCNQYLAVDRAGFRYKIAREMVLFDEELVLGLGF